MIPFSVKRGMMLVLLAAGLLMSSAHAAPTSVTLVTYNIHVGVPMGEAIGRYRVGLDDLRAQADVITSAAADIVGLQEVDSVFGLTLPPARQRSSLLPMPRVLSHLTGLAYVFGSAMDDIGYPSDNAEYVEWGTADQWTNNGAVHGEMGNALLTRYPLAAVPENIPLPRMENHERRACIRAELVIPGAGEIPVVVYAAHLQHNSSQARAEQMQAILDRAQRDAETRLVFILGDLNHAAEGTEGGERNGGSGDSPNPYSLALQSGFHDLHALYATSRGEKPAGTYPADQPNRRIDFILCSRPLRVLEAEVVSSMASDHLPVRVVVELPQPESES